MINRRKFLEVAAGASATLALAPELLRPLQTLQTLQQPGGRLIQRAIPSTGEKLPVIALGFANHAACADPVALREVLKTFYDNGGRFFDTNHGNEPNAQQTHATLANELGIQNKLFWSLRAIAGNGGRASAPPSSEALQATFESLFATFKVPKVDLMLGHPDTDPSYWAILKQAKKEGRIRYLGAMITSFMPAAQVEAIVRTEPIDFIGVDYGVERRDAEAQILPLALERKIAVMAFFPFGGANGASCVSDKGTFARVANTPLPAWAAEFDAKTWAQFFLKYVISHPAVTVTRVGTTNAAHMLDDIGGGTGRLPTQAMRARMAEFIEALPLAVPQFTLDRYAGEYRAASGLTAVFRRDGDRLLVKAGSSAEVPINARTARRFADAQGSIYEFQMAGVGPAIRSVAVILEKRGEKITLERK